jgi:hypothetical protein
MNRPNASLLPKSKSLDKYFHKKDLLSAKPPPSKTRPLVHADKPIRTSNKRKYITQVENQSDLNKYILEENETIKLDIVPDEPVAVTDEKLEQKEVEILLREEKTSGRRIIFTYNV